MVSNFQTGQFSTSILHTQTSPGKLSESLFVQTPLLCLQDLLPTSACESNHLPTSLCLSPDKLSEFSLVQTLHLCLQDSLPTSACRDILTMLTSRQVVGAFTCPNTSLVSPGPTPNLSLSRYSQSFQKHVVSGNQLTSHFHQMTSQPTCHKK